MNELTAINLYHEAMSPEEEAWVTQVASECYTAGFAAGISRAEAFINGELLPAVRMATNEAKASLLGDPAIVAGQMVADAIRAGAVVQADAFTSPRRSVLERDPSTGLAKEATSYTVPE
jgi:hypothetical protein